VRWPASLTSIRRLGLVDVLRRLADHPALRLCELLTSHQRWAASAQRLPPSQADDGR
jgi:hypothetical protein